MLVLTPEFDLIEIGQPIPEEVKPFFDGVRSYIEVQRPDHQTFYASKPIAAKFFGLTPGTLNVYLSVADGKPMTRYAHLPDEALPVEFTLQEVAGTRRNSRVRAQVE